MWYSYLNAAASNSRAPENLCKADEVLFSPVANRHYARRIPAYRPIRRFNLRWNEKGNRLLCMLEGGGSINGLQTWTEDSRREIWRLGTSARRLETVLKGGAQCSAFSGDLGLAQHYENLFMVVFLL